MNNYFETLLSLVFLLTGFSLVASAILELLSSAGNRRGRFLRDMIKIILPESHRAFENHALFRSVAFTSSNREYLDPHLFARIVLAMHEGGQLGAEERLAVAPLMVGADTEFDKLRNIEAWFRAAMEHVSGAYKRWSQVWLLFIGLFVCGVTNCDIIRVGGSIYNSESLRTQLVQAALQEAKSPAPSEAVIKAALNQTLPLGSTPQAGNWPGIILTAIGISFGAPFWFELLQRLLRLRGASEGGGPVVAQ